LKLGTGRRCFKHGAHRRFTAPDTLPWDIFDATKVAAVLGLTDRGWAGQWPEKVMKDERSKRYRYPNEGIREALIKTKRARY
jgi:hypothetical protein